MKEIEEVEQITSLKIGKMTSFRAVQCTDIRAALGFGKNLVGLRHGVERRAYLWGLDFWIGPVPVLKTIIAVNIALWIYLLMR